MKTYLLFCVLLFSFALLSCEDEKLPLNVNKHQKFEGSFKVKTDTKAYNQSGTSTLEISNGSYKGYTFDGHIHSAGKLHVSTNKITFMDTVFKIYTTEILPPTCLKGTYDYAFDGNTLQIGNKHGSGWVETHTFRLKD
jgi:hypothetical protein